MSIFEKRFKGAAEENEGRTAKDVVGEIASPQEVGRETAIVYEKVKDPILSIIENKKIRLEEALFPENMKLVLEGIQEEGLAMERDMHLPVVEGDWKKTIQRAVREKIKEGEDERERRSTKIA
ncbi:MAG: hypothetical protein NUW02_00470 [Candidatus Campbellbacteria bacterium]|nr:hypothetical protein [Candidatus Campbellbacteria bacterium]